MDPGVLNTEEDGARLKVSIIDRLTAALAFVVPVIGGALSSLLLMNMFRALKANKNAGMAAIMGGMKEASLPAIVSFYLAAGLGLVVVVVLIVRMLVRTNTASPPFWFFALGGLLCFLPAGLFWKAQLLILDVLSPGSSVGAGGIGGVGGQISELLLISVIAAPIVVIILIVASVVPLSSRSGPKVFSLIVATAITLLFIATAVAIPFLIDGPERKNEIVSLPVNVKFADHDSDIEKETSMVLTLTADNKLYVKQTRNQNGRVERTETAITQQELPDRIVRAMGDKTPDKRIVYFKCDVNASNENVLQIFDIIRRADLDKVSLVVIGEKNADDPYQTAPVMFEVRLPAPLDETGGIESRRPNPLLLVARLEKEGKLTLNNEGVGALPDTKKLETLLIEIFKNRENTGVFREGTNEIEKQVFLSVSKSARYGDVIKLVEAVKASGAQPVAVQIDGIYW